MDAGRRLDERMHTLIGRKFYGETHDLADAVLPLYSTTMDGAWLIVEWLASKGWYCHLNHEIQRIVCWIGHESWTTNDIYKARSLLGGPAKTAPLAVCEATLKVVEYGIERFGALYGSDIETKNREERNDRI